MWHCLQRLCEQEAELNGQRTKCSSEIAFQFLAVVHRSQLRLLKYEIYIFDVTLFRVKVINVMNEVKKT